MAEIKIPKKLIEVALPLDIINKAAAREKSIRHGHPSTLHLWWARRPLAAARAVIFAQMVNDPGYERHLGRGVNKEKAQKERERLFGIIEKLVIWENSNNEEILNEARLEIWKSWKETCALNKNHPRASELFNPSELPGLHDPFAGGGAIPIEAQRLGISAFASDLNPVAVMINKAMIEIPSRFSGIKPVGQNLPKRETSGLDLEVVGAQCLAEDIKRYGNWIREEALKRIGHLYPPIMVTDELVKERPDLKHLKGTELTVIAYVWARTVKSPNPAFSHVNVPLASSFYLSKRKEKEAWVDPLVDGDCYKFKVRTGPAPERVQAGTKASGRGANFLCILSGAPISAEYIRAESKAGRMGARLLGIVAEAPSGRIYIDPLAEQENLALSAQPTWFPDTPFFAQALGFRIGNYGMSKWSDLFTQRQLCAMSTFSDLVSEAVNKCYTDAIKAGFSDDGKTLQNGGTGAKAYSEALGLYLACCNSKAANLWSSLCFWMNDRGAMRETFGRQVLSMVWDFAEANPFSSSGGNYLHFVQKVAKALEFTPARNFGKAEQADATNQRISTNKVICTDPPYYDNIGYADLSDFFYVWLKKSLKSILPDLFVAETVPKSEELVATPARHGGREGAENFFLQGMKKTMRNMNELSHPAFPITVFYAFKQSKTVVREGTSSTGWETFLEAVLSSGYSITGTWPVRTEQSAALKSSLNALASSIVLVATRRSHEAPVISRREFIRELNATLPIALEEMTTGGEHSPVAPVDLSQAIIGPGMAIFSKYSAVLEADGKAMSVRTALQLINRFFAEDEFDHDTQFCLQWFQGYGWDKGSYGEADVLARAKGTSVEGLKQRGVVESASGILRILRPKELQEGWLPESDNRISIWEILHHMIKAFNKNGESGAGAILAKTHQYTEAIRTLAYRLYTACERKNWASDAGLYNSLIVAWDNIEASAQSFGYTGTQISMFNEESESKENASKSKSKARKKS